VYISGRETAQVAAHVPEACRSSKKRMATRQVKAVWDGSDNGAHSRGMPVIQECRMTRQLKAAWDGTCSGAHSRGMPVIQKCRMTRQLKAAWDGMGNGAHFGGMAVIQECRTTRQLKAAWMEQVAGHIPEACPSSKNVGQHGS
jgi:hypothetical protein